MHTTPPEGFQDSEGLQGGGRAVILSINIPFKSQAIAAPRQDLQKLQMEGKIVKKVKLHFFAGANRLGEHSLNLSFLSYFSMPKICKERRMGESKFMATVSLQ